MSKQTVRSKIKSLTRAVFDLNLSKFKKILLSTGFLVLGICTVGQLVYAEPVITGVDKSTNMVKVKIKETEEGYTIKELKTKVGEADAQSIDPSNLEEWTVTAGGTEVVALVKLSEGVTSLVAISGKEGENDLSYTKAISEMEGAGPKVVPGTLLKYHSDEYGDYIQAQFEDDLSKVWKITDENDENRVVLNEKEQDKKVTLKYILNGSTEESASSENKNIFYVYDIDGNKTKVDVSEAVDVTFNARTRDGSRFVLGVSDKITRSNVEYKLDSIVTGSGQEIDYHGDSDMYGKIGTGGEGDNEDADLNEIVGVTKLVLTYKADGHEDIEVKLPLILDKTTPEVVGYVATMDPDGTYEIEKIKANIRKNVTEQVASNSVKLRAYVNNTTDKCIVEVRDVQSGIDTIQLLKGSAGAYKLIEKTAISEDQKAIAKKAGYDSHGKLMTSVLHLFSFEGLNDRVTAVRVTDGLGNERDIPVEVSTVEKEDTIIYAKLEEYPDSNGKPAYRVVAQDFKAGLWKIERDTDNEGVKQILVNFESPDASGIVVEKMVDGVPTKVTSAQEIENWLEIAGQPGISMYEQYTLGRVVRNINKEGQPTIMVYDALGNARQVSFDDIAFYCYYATYNKTGSLAIDLKENRGVWKITTCIVSPEDAEREVSCMYTYRNSNDVEVSEVPVDSNEPLYDGQVPSNGSVLEPGKEFFITTENNEIPSDYKSATDNRPKYITSAGKEVVPNNGLGNGKNDPEFFSTEAGSSPEGYESAEDNRPKYNGEVPNDGLDNKPKSDNNVYDKNKDNRPKYDGEVPSASNEPKYKGLVPTDGTNGTIDNRPKYNGELADNNNEPKYTIRVGDEEVTLVPVSLGSEPTRPEAEPALGDSPSEADVIAHKEWLKTKVIHDAWANKLEASELAKYMEVLAEHDKWKTAYNEYNQAETGWLAKQIAHTGWETKMNEYNEWRDVLADYNEWKEVRGEYLEWKDANTEHVKWQDAKLLHQAWEQSSIKEYTLEVFREDHEPNRLVKTYQVPDGVVQKVTVYHEHDRDDLFNEITSVMRKNAAGLQDVSELKDDEVLHTTVADIKYDRTIDGSDQSDAIVGVTARASRGIKLVEYVDKTVVEFNKDLPKELFINCECVPPNENKLIATVVDSVGCKLTIYSDKVEYKTYNNSAQPVSHEITVSKVASSHDPEETHN